MSNSKQSAKCLSILGTGSDVGKSIVVAALCRIFKDRGLSVAPYKAQNMSNNSSVTAEGGEMGRAQVVQAQAAKIEPHVDMNPVLLKPSSNVGSQVVLQGKPVFNKAAGEYYQMSEMLFARSLESLDRLRSQYELIIMEGAGSCGEVNLRNRDFVNFKTARAADAPVLLVADIDRGGVFAQILGTLAVSPEEDRKRVKGFIINRFRGDATLFDGGIDYIERQTSLPVLGLVPYYTHIKIDSEDAVLLEDLVDPADGPQSDKINVATLRFPHISNFTDFSPLENNRRINLHYLSFRRKLDGYDLLILPGTKNVRGDLKWLNANGWPEEILRYRDNGGEIAGICGGYQMLGEVIHDPHGVEGAPGSDPGLGLLEMETTMESEKTLCRSSGIWLESGTEVSGYEIHMGLTKKRAELSPAISLCARNGEPVSDTDGVVSPDKKIWGTYFHGLFNNADFNDWLFKKLKTSYEADSDRFHISDFRNSQYDLLADHFRDCLDIDRIAEIIGL